MGDQKANHKDMLKWRLAVRDSVVILPSVKEEVILDSVQKQQLAAILLGYATVDSLSESTMCYSPRHAIIWADQAGVVHSFIEVCLECDMSREYPEAQGLGKLCFEQFMALREFFEAVGITYGLKR